MRCWVIATAAALACASGLEAQMPGASERFDLRAYAGIAWTSPWLETNDGTTFGIGTNPIFGGVANWWLRPRIGVRAHLGYMPSDVPQPNPIDAFASSDPNEPTILPQGRMHNWFYDLGVAVRPFARTDGTGGRLSSGYVFIGAGAFTANPEGGNPDDCVPPYNNGGACLSYSARNSTVGQGTAGLGFTLIPITRSLGLFTEAAVHVYSSPFHIGQNWTGLPPCPTPACQANDRMAMTTRLVGGAVLALGPPRRPPPPPLLPPPPPAPPREDRPIIICVAVDGIPRYVEARIQPETNDTVVVTPQGVRRPLRAAYPIPAPTAAGADWFLREDNLFFAGRTYLRFGVPREEDAEQLRRVGEYQGVPLFRRACRRSCGRHVEVGAGAERGSKPIPSWW
jgi:hypothetical protein